MLSIGVISDIHAEFRDFTHLISLIDKIEKSDFDILINAGDTHPYHSCRHLFDLKGKKYFEVLGNHDFYGSQIGCSKWVEEVQGIKIVGCTLWTNFNQGDPLAEQASKNYMVDFRKITPISENLIIDMKKMFDECVNFIDHQKPDVVVTHHVPSLKFCHPRFGVGPINYSFASNLDNFILDNPNIKLWIFGHTHDPYDSYIGKCKMICNPLGYPKERYPKDLDYEVKIVEM